MSQQASVSREYMEMHQEIAKTVQNLAKEVEIPSLALINTILQEQVNKQQPITMVIDVPVEREKFCEHMRQLATIIEKNQPNLKETLSRILDVLHIEKDVDAIINAAKTFNSFYFEDFAKRHQLNSPILQFLSEIAYRPYLKAFAAAVSDKINIEKYHSSHCPVCGDIVRVVRSGKDGEREGCCVRCGTVWNIKRLQCPFCNNNDHEKLRYITVGEDEDRKLYVCEVCKGYTKFVDMSDLLEVPDFFLVDLETIYLDMVAAQQGYGVEEKNDKDVM